MKLQEFNFEPVVLAQKALSEHYNMPFNLKKMNISESRSMLSKVRRLISETRQSPSFYKSQNDPSYLKLVFMEQALTKHEAHLRSLPRPRIVVENEEVEKSQVVLAAQDMVDEVQKMLEKVSDLMVKEMPALVDSVQSEIGVTESEQFNQQVTEALTGLTAAMTQAKTTLQGALNTITGLGGDPAAFAGEDPAMADPNALPPAPEGDLGAEEFPAPEGDMEEPAEEPVAGVGRARR